MRCVVRFQVLQVNRTPMSRLIWPIQTGLPAKWSVVSQSRRCRRSLIERRLRCRATSWRAAEQMQRAHGRVAILGAQQERSRRLPARREGDRFAFIPAGAKRAKIVANSPITTRFTGSPVRFSFYWSSPRVPPRAAARGSASRTRPVLGSDKWRRNSDAGNRPESRARQS